MDVKKLALMLGALVLAAASAMMARSMFGGPAAPLAVAAVPRETGPEVLVATRTLPVGTIVSPDMLRYQPWPKDLIEQAYYLKSGVPATKLSGTVVRYAITAGQPLTQGALVQPGERGFLAAALGPGMRAVTVPVSAQSGITGLVFPGDRVDVVLSQSVVGGGEGQPLKVSETIVRNMRVLAIDQQTDKVAGGDKADISNAPATAAQTVTLEATPRIAEKIAVAQTIGQISLSLRSLAADRQELERAIAAGEVDVPKGEDPDAERRMMLAVAARPADTDTTYTTGADVSRFQRRTIPGRADSAAPSVGIVAAGVPAAPSGPVVRVARGNTVSNAAVGRF